MNSRQKETLEIQIKNEKTAIRDLKKQYEKALTDINAKIRALQTDEITQSKIYQIEYQKALKGQIEAILDNLNSNQYDSINDYLNKSYEDGFIGTLYDLQGQGIPLIFPINQDQVARAIVTNSKISEGLYNKLGVDTTALKKAIRTELTRGIAQGMSYTDMARNIENQIRIGLNRAIRIARTEGHRISIESSLDAMHKAKDRGADIVKQWDATMDGRTRPHHRELDGQVRELDEPFEVAGMKVNAPHQFGKASEDVNCRCVVLQRARWAIDDEEYTKMNGETNELVHLKERDYQSFKKAYNEAVEDIDNGVLKKPIHSKDKYYEGLLTGAEKNGVKYNPVYNHSTKLTEDEIISALSGGDNTSGSCASLGLAYIGQKQGWNVLDFRGGNSQNYFSNGFNLFTLSHAEGLKILTATGKSTITIGNRLLKQCEVGKEYYLCVGRHASIVRRLEDGMLQYLELQSPTRSGWTNFNGNPRFTLSTRFGCSNSQYSASNFMIDIDESDFSTDDFKSLLGYLNTSLDEQRKGKHGTIK